MITRYALLLAALALPAVARAQTAADSSAIRATALDYVEGWYDGNAERMSRAVHPELVKRIVVSDTATKRSVI
ncbi:MAG TPA: nuclear transport factor 2 family protein, partial [Gemmatimonadales bacterium]|nr:nuclear transport factor 2 family protein [Gemmatimonadales bacterium]